MTTEIDKKLLQNKQAVEEINRHRWIESEKAGYDIGFEKASMDWLERFSTAWMQYHLPKRKNSEAASPAPTRRSRKTPSNKSSK